MASGICCPGRLFTGVRRLLPSRLASTLPPDWGIKFTKDQIPKDRLNIKFVRSSGPGGQNVNKVSTKVELRFELDAADWLPEPVRIKLKEQEANRINKSGEFIVTSDRYRTQPENIQDALSKLHDCIGRAAFVPSETSPETKARIAQYIKKAEANARARKQYQKSKKTDRSRRD